MSNQLPPGFTVDKPSGGLPPGFTVDPPPKREEYHPVRRFIEGMSDPVYGAAQIADKVINPIRQYLDPGASSMEDLIRERDQQYAAPEGFDWARMTGGVANPLNYMGGGSGAVQSTVAQKLAPSAAEASAFQAVLQPTAAGDDNTTFAAKKTGQAALGAVLGRVLGGAKPTPEAQKLLDKNVRLTGAQASGGAANNIEQKLTSMPYTGAVIERARKQPSLDFQARALEEATGLKNVPTIDEANKAISRLYESVVPKLKPTAEGFDNAVNALETALKNPEMTDQNRKVLQGIVNKHFANYTDLDGPALQRLQSELGHIARSYSGRTASPSEKVLAQEVYNVLHGLREGLLTALKPEDAAKFSQATNGFRKLIAHNYAAATRADELITPRALQKAMARAARTDTTRLPPDDLVDSAIKVLTGTVPDSGTAGRLSAISIPGQAVGLALSPFAAAGYGTGRQLQKLGPTREALARALAAAARGGVSNEED